MEGVKKAPAKVNLCLIVGPTDEEGYHELFTVFAPVDLCDELNVKLQARPTGESPGELKIKCQTADGEDNLAYKALKLLEENSVIKNSLGNTIYEAFTRAKWSEWDQFRISVTDWEVGRYLEIA